MARGSRGDILTAVSLINRFVTRWSAVMDTALRHLFGYVFATPDVVLSNFVDTRDYAEMVLPTQIDSDHAGCPLTARSTGGALSRLTGPFGSDFTILLTESSVRGVWHLRRRTRKPPAFPTA